jgi:hypothetical protein
MKGACHLSSGSIALACLLVCGVALSYPAVLAAGQKIKNNDQLLLVRGLAYEIAVAKIPLPWGKRGIHIDGKGNIDQSGAMRELESKGESVKPGTPVEITGIKFRRGRILLAINGGGKAGGHWYDHLQIMAPISTSVVPSRTTTPNNGSYITVSLPPHDPDPTVGQVKKLLGEVLDFHRRSPTVLYSPSIPPEFKKAIKQHKVLVGMDRNAVLSAKGVPDKKIRKDLPDGSEEEDWLYGNPPHVLFVIMKDDVVSQIKQY